jgi:hypothetical protein
MSIDLGMDKQNVVYPYNEIFRDIEEWSTKICYNMGEFHKHSK